mmetsp:Transcript_35256/g.71415  ORF Transcript_35256/g.71415 Transcript_35256/m.71415 type:complete len:287 (+) Transcript_35256:237-1097(+)
MKLRFSLAAFLLSLATLLAGVCSTVRADDNAEATANVGDRISIELYFESQCPGCREVLTTSFKQAYAAPGFLKMADVTLVPFGNAEETPSADGDGYDFKCQHGPSECRYNAVEACALSKIKCPYMAFRYVTCIESYDESREPDQNYGLVVGACAALTGVSEVAADIEQCSTSSEGNDLIHANAVKTAALDPPHTYVPWIVAGGIHDDDVQDSISESLLQYVCQKYHGPDKSPACAQFAKADDDGLSGAMMRGSSSTATGLHHSVVNKLASRKCVKDREVDVSSAQE